MLRANDNCRVIGFRLDRIGTAIEAHVLGGLFKLCKSPDVTSVKGTRVLLLSMAMLAQNVFSQKVKPVSSLTENLWPGSVHGPGRPSW